MMPEIDSNDIIEDILSIEKLKPISDITSKVSTILDVGGGSGRIWNLSGVEKDIALLDIDLSNTEIKNPYSHLIAESAERAHFFSGEYDLVTMMGLLEYLDDPRKVLANIFKTGPRYVYITVPNAASFHRRVELEMESTKSLDEFNQQDLDAGYKRVFDILGLSTLCLASVVDSEVAYVATKWGTVGFKHDIDKEPKTLKSIEHFSAMQNVAKEIGLTGNMCTSFTNSNYNHASYGTDLYVLLTRTEVM